MGVVQDLNRLTYNSALSHLRKVNLNIDASAKVVGPRLLHSSQWGIIDPVDTPDGENVGLHKHMAITAYITRGCSQKHITDWLENNTDIQLTLLDDVTGDLLKTNQTKLFVNGNWIGVVSKPSKTQKLIKEYRRSGLIPLYTSISWDITNNVINIYTDSGRLCRPVFFRNDTGRAGYQRTEITERITNSKFSWKQLVGGFAEKKTPSHDNRTSCKCLTLQELYDTSNIDDLKATQSIIEYMDTALSLIHI